MQENFLDVRTSANEWSGHFADCLKLYLAFLYLVFEQLGYLVFEILYLIYIQDSILYI